jgi:hypothetical protein
MDLVWSEFVELLIVPAIAFEAADVIEPLSAAITSG